MLYLSVIEEPHRRGLGLLRLSIHEKKKLMTLVRELLGKNSEVSGLMIETKFEDILLLRNTAAVVFLSL